MPPSLRERVLEWIVGEESPDLRVRIFRLVTLTTTALCLGLIIPINFLQHLPVGVHVGTALLCLSSLAFHAASRRGTTLCGSFLLVSLLLVDTIWFWNGGSQGSVTYFFAPFLLFSLAVYRGLDRALVALAQGINASSLFVIEHFFPEWVVPFETPMDRLIDHGVGILAAALATTIFTWFIIRSHSSEQERLAELAGRLATSEDRYREIFDSTNDALFIHAADGRILDVNARACAMFGFDRPTALRLSIEDISFGRSPYGFAEAREKAELALKGQPQTFEWHSRRQSGELFWSEVGLKTCSLAGATCVIASVRDISTRKQVQHELLANEERLRLAMLAAKQGWFEINVQTGLGISSPEYPRLLGFAPAEFVTSVQGWLDAIHPDDRETARKELREAVETGAIRALEYRRRTRDGSWKWIRSVGRIVDRDESGRPLRLIGMHTDITERKELEAQLLHSQRIEAVGTLASGVAHDLNNILTPMIMGAGLLRDRLADPEDRELMTMIEASGRRGAAIVKQLLAFSRAVTSERRPLIAADLIHEVVQLIRSTFPKEITVVEKIDDRSCRIDGDSTQLHQVLVNLAVNARDAMPGGGTLTVGLECAAATAPGIRAGSGASGAFLVFRVADTGHGIAPEIRDRIFDPFFTTKGPGKGTGLGLATVHGIVTAHRGFVRFESTPGAGTEFRVYLPMLHPSTRPEPAAAASPIKVAAPTHHAVATVLVVDDEPAVLRMIQRLLASEHFNVLAASSAADALRRMRERASDIDLIVTDFMMPEMDGPTLVPLLREIRPDVKIIGVSGLDQRERAAELGLVDVLCKPFEGEALLQAVNRALGRS